MRLIMVYYYGIVLEDLVPELINKNKSHDYYRR